MSSYMWIHLFSSKDQAKIGELGQWLKEYRQPAMFQSPAINRATLYELRRAQPGVPPYFAIYRFDAYDYREVRDELQDHYNEVVKKDPEPKFVKTEQTLFYEEINKFRRIEPKNPRTAAILQGSGNMSKYADFGFSHSADEKRGVEFIEWYRVYRQHDVCRSGGTYDNATMGLLCPGQDYKDYIFTIYEYMCENQDLAQLYAFGYVSGALNWLRGSDLYIPGYIGMTKVVDDLFKKYCGSNDLVKQHALGVFK